MRTLEISASSSKTVTVLETENRYDFDFIDFCGYDSDKDPEFIPQVLSDTDTDSDVEIRNVKKRKKEVKGLENSELAISQATEFSVQKETSVEEGKPKKHIRQENMWKCNIRKANIASGKQYISKKGKGVQGRKMKPSCGPNCRLKCSSKICEEDRYILFNNYWDGKKTWDTKRQYLVSRVSELQVKRKRPVNGTKSRDVTYGYSFEIGKEKIVVCRKFFLATLAISGTAVNTALKKKEAGGIIETDKRGHHPPPNKVKQNIRESVIEHISKFPTYESHYSRERTQRKYLGSHLSIEQMFRLYEQECKDKNIPSSDIAKNWLYRQIFNTKFNLGFHQPCLDTCNNCDMYKIQLKESKSEEEQNKIKQGQENHLQDAQYRYQLKKQDKQESMNENKKKVLTVDLQKCLATPVLTNADSFYLRKLWTFNYTIYDSSKKQGYCVMWDESKGGRGGIEMASGILKWALNELPNSDIEELIVWSDNCAAQNRNMAIIACYLWLLHNFKALKVINHKYLLKGHTHMEVDTIHSIIERAKKKQPHMSIVTP